MRMRTSTILSLCTPILFVSLALHAQDTQGANSPTAPSADPAAAPVSSAPATTPADAAPAGRQRMSPDQMANGLAKRLQLTDTQKTQITPILADRQQKMEALQADNSGRPMQRMKKMKAIQDDADGKLNAIFTPDQQKQYAKIEEERKEKMKEQRQQRQSGGNAN